MLKVHPFLAGPILITALCAGPASAQNMIPRLDRIQALYDDHEKNCLQKGWQRRVVRVDGRERQLLWKAPKDRWRNGAIIALHGGGGTYSNFCSNIRIGAPMVAFGELALKEGFAVFTLDSGRDLMLDAKGQPCGKRWDCLDQDRRPNHDLAFIEQVITDVIPSVRPDNSAKDVFMTGISNGGFMTILASTQLNDKIRAFAPVSAGDPYGIDIECGDHSTLRKNAPGRWYDKDTRIEMGKKGACSADRLPDKEQAADERPGQNLPFKQFHHEGDPAVDISCMGKAQRLLTQEGYQDAGPYILKNVGPRRLWKHFWLGRYNAVLLEFFKSQVRQKSEKQLNP